MAAELINLQPVDGSVIQDANVIQFDIRIDTPALTPFEIIFVVFEFAALGFTEVAFRKDPKVNRVFEPAYAAGSTVEEVLDPGFERWRFRLLRTPKWPSSPKLALYGVSSQLPPALVAITLGGLLLTGTNQKIEVTTSRNTLVDINAGWLDFADTDFSAQSNRLALSTPTTQDLIVAPVLGRHRQVKSLSVVNRDHRFGQLVQISKNVGGTARTLRRVDLGPRSGIQYIDGRGWRRINRGFPGTQMTKDSGHSFGATSATDGGAISAGVMVAMPGGTASHAIRKATLRLRLTASSTPTWAEAFLLKSGVAPMGTQSSGTSMFRIVGVADALTMLSASGLRDVTVSVDATQVIAPGENVWVGLALSNGSISYRAPNSGVAEVWSTGTARPISSAQSPGPVRPSEMMGMLVPFGPAGTGSPVGEWYAITLEGL